MTDSAAPPRAVELREHDAVERDPLLEGLGDRDRLLAGHGVEHEQDVRRLDGVLDPAELRHQVLVDLEAPGRVDDHDVAALRARLLDPHLRGLDRLSPGEDRDLDLPSELLELVDGGRTLEVGGDERRRAVLLAEQQRQLGGGGRLARALETGEQDHGRPLAREDELGVPGAHQRRQLLVDDLHHLLAGSEAARDVLAERALLDAPRSP